MNQFLMFFILLAFFSSVGFSTVEGNGSHGIVCYDASGTVKSVEVLDHFQAKNAGFGKKLTSVEEGLEILFSRVQQVEVGRADKLRFLYEDYKKNVTYL